MLKYFVILLIIWNVITFLVMGLDKSKAKRDKRRISEKTLLTLSFVFGGFGIGLGAIIWHHKTQKTKFRICIPLSIIFNILMIYGIIKYVI